MTGPGQPGRVSGEIAPFEVGDEPGADPVALVLGIEEFAVDHAETGGRTEARGPGLYWRRPRRCAGPSRANAPGSRRATSLCCRCRKRH